MLRILSRPIDPGKIEKVAAYKVDTTVISMYLKLEEPKMGNQGPCSLAWQGSNNINCEYSACIQLEVWWDIMQYFVYVCKMLCLS